MYKQVTGRDAVNAYIDGHIVYEQPVHKGVILPCLMQISDDIKLNKLLTGKTENDQLEFKFYIQIDDIKLDMNLPKPFIPKEGELYWYIETGNYCGYANDIYHKDKLRAHKDFGMWKTENDIIEIVNAYKKLGAINDKLD